MSKNYVTLIDAGGRNIIGNCVSGTPETITIQNPMMILVQPKPDNTGQLSVQLIPLFLAEFIKVDENKSRNYRLTYNRSSIAIGENIAFAEQLTTIYDKIDDQLFNDIPVPQSSPTPQVIKLFDDETK